MPQISLELCAVNFRYFVPLLWLLIAVRLCCKCLLYPFHRHWSQAFYETDLLLSGFPAVMVRTDIPRSVPFKVLAHQHIGQSLSRFVAHLMYGTLGLLLLSSHVRFTERSCLFCPLFLELVDTVSFENMMETQWCSPALEDFNSSSQNNDGRLGLEFLTQYVTFLPLHLRGASSPVENGWRPLPWTDRAQSAPEAPTKRLLYGVVPAMPGIDKFDPAVIP